MRTEEQNEKAIYWANNSEEAIALKESLLERTLSDN